MSEPTREEIRSIVLDALARKLGGRGHSPSALDEASNLSELGLIDSKDLLDIILEVEERARSEFNPEGIDMERGLTLAMLIGAFVGPVPVAST